MEDLMRIWRRNLGVSSGKSGIAWLEPNRIKGLSQLLFGANKVEVAVPCHYCRIDSEKVDSDYNEEAMKKVCMLGSYTNTF
jgi:hypothetical protein